MELRGRTARLIAVAGVACAVLLGAAVPAASAAGLEQPPSQTTPPRGFRLTAQQAIRIADRTASVAQQRRRHRIRPTAYIRPPGRWQVSYFDRSGEKVQVQIDDRLRTVLEQWTGAQVAWTMARGYAGAFARKLNAPYVWIPLCVLFLVPFVDPRRPFRLLHLDLLVLLAFSASHVFFNRGEIGVSVPLVYPVLAYLLARLLWVGFRGRERRERLVPLVPTDALVLALVFLALFRIGLNVVDSNVIDVGYAGVIGADRIADGDRLYGRGFSRDVEHGDTYGPVNYLAYVPFEQALPWSGSWDDLPAAHAAAIAFDLAVILGLLLLGVRLRAGPEGRRLGAALAFAWTAYPYSLFALNTNSNDTLPAAIMVWALVALTLDPPRRALSAGLRGGLVALAAAAKFAPLALAPLLATAGGNSERRVRQVVVFGVVLAAVAAAAIVPFIPHGGLREMYDRTVGYQAARPSPFSIWGQEPGLHWLQTVVKVAAAALALAVAFVPRRKSPLQVAALAAAVLIAVQLTVSHWFYLYIAWFAPLALVGLLGIHRDPVARVGAPERPPEPTRAHAPEPEPALP